MEIVNMKTEECYLFQPALFVYTIFAGFSVRLYNMHVPQRSAQQSLRGQLRGMLQYFTNAREKLAQYLSESEAPPAPLPKSFASGSL